MTERAHVRECAERFRRTEESRTAWHRLWPKACATCAGRGGVAIRDLVSGRDTFEECHDCLAISVCPRCEEGLLSGPYTRCMHCGWQGPNDGEPLHAGCICRPEVSYG